MTDAADRPKGRSVRPLAALLPFFRPYRGTLVLATLALVISAGAMLALPVAARYVIDRGFAANDAATINLYFGWFLLAAVVLGVFAAIREVGCGMGYFLAYARTQGYSVSGTEYAALGAKVAREKFGLNVVQSSFVELPVTESTHDVIFFGDVLEHLLRPLEMLRKAHRMTKLGGVVAAEVPSMFNSIVGRGAMIAFRILGTSKRMPMPPYHVNEFTPATLKAMFRAAGFSQVKIVQRIKRPDTITLRGTLFEKAAKKSLQYPNYAITKTVGLFGHRLLGIGVKSGAS